MCAHIQCQIENPNNSLCFDYYDVDCDTIKASWCVPAFLRNVVLLKCGHPQEGSGGGDGENSVHTSRNGLGIVT
jgi:hypothetical protein